MRGDAVHAYVLSDKPVKERLKAVPESERTWCETIDLEDIQKGRYEVPFGFLPRSGTGRHLSRDPETGKLVDLKEDELVGTADIFARIMVGEEPAVFIGEVKSGLALHVPPVKQCLQTAFYVVAAARAEGLSMGMVTIYRIGENGRVTPDTAIFDGWHLDALELELADVVRRVKEQEAIREAGGQPRVSSGRHCDYCPAFHACPAKVNLALTLATGKLVGLEKEIMGLLTPETAAQAYLRYKEVQEVLNRVREGIYGYARLNPVELGNGYVISEVEVSRPKLDGVITHKVLTALYGQETADGAVKLSTSKTAVRNALRGKVPYGTLASQNAAVQRAIQEEGGLAITHRTEVKVHRQGVLAAEED